jgi:UDP-4-amino-4-deoxy-L-arabinose formyltransferase/UDP-glucuronic acid dehydrogenase (UDP-4-keto-hexauronic acid decarboxylating)
VDNFDMRIALLCEESAGARVLEMLARSAHELVAVLTTQGSAAAKLGLQPIAPARVREPGFCAYLASLKPDLLLNVHSLHIVPPAMLAVPPLGAYNLHPGPLPQYAGLNAPSWAIYNGERSHGVTLHRMEAGIDTGPIAYQETFAIEESDTGLSVAVRCAQKGVDLVRKLLDGVVPTLTPQDLSRRRYFGREVPQGGHIDWNAPARRIHDFVRACDYRPFRSPWGTPRAQLGEKQIDVLKTALTGERCDASPGTVRNDVYVATADEWLCLRQVACAPLAAAAEDRPRQSQWS